jgi:hypothetical protein
MRSLAAFVAQSAPDILALSEIDAGNALAIATRFALDWAYRGGQALFWNRRFVAERVHDLYLPATGLRAFDRRGLLRVDGRCDDVALSLLATQFAADRTRIRDLRFTRSSLRGIAGKVALFAVDPGPGRGGFADLGLRSVAAEGTDGLTLGARGYDVRMELAAQSHDGIGARLVAQLRA